MPPELEAVAGGVKGLSSGDVVEEAEVAAGSTGLGATVVTGFGFTGLAGVLAAADDEAPAAPGVAVLTTAALDGAALDDAEDDTGEDETGDDVVAWTAGIGGGGRMSLTGGLRSKASALGNCEKSWNNKTLTKSIAERFE